MIFIKGVKMEHKKKYGFSGFALLTIAIVSLVGVGFAVAYTGSATMNGNPADGQTVTVDLTTATSGFIAGSYAVSTVNDGTDITLSGLKKGDTPAVLDDMEFAWDGVKFVIAGEGAEDDYDCAVAGTVTVTVRQVGATPLASSLPLTITNAQGAQEHQYGLSFLYVYNGQIFNPASGITVAMTDGVGTAEITAYVIYSKSVPHADIGSIAGFSLTGSTLTFTASVE